MPNTTIMATSDNPSSTPESDFAPTRWSMVLAAGDWLAGSTARRAMEELAKTYWFPLYAYLRRRGSPPEEAEDLAQGFFTQLLEKDSLAAVDRTKGKFRAFLLASLKHFLTNQWDKTQAQKRGGGTTPIALDALTAEARYTLEPVDNMTPERLFEQRWAWAVLDQVLQRLRDQYQAKGQSQLFDALKGSLTSGTPTPTYAALARQLGMPEGTLAVAAHRLRRRYRELLRDEIAQTVSAPELIDEEIRFLLGCL